MFDFPSPFSPLFLVSFGLKVGALYSALSNLEDLDMLHLPLVLRGIDLTTGHILFDPGGLFKWRFCSRCFPRDSVCVCVCFLEFMPALLSFFLVGRFGSPTKIRQNRRTSWHPSLRPLKSAGPSL